MKAVAESDQAPSTSRPSAYTRQLEERVEQITRKKKGLIESDAEGLKCKIRTEQDNVQNRLSNVRKEPAWDLSLQRSWEDRRSIYGIFLQCIEYYIYFHIKPRCFLLLHCPHSDSVIHWILWNACTVCCTFLLIKDIVQIPELQMSDLCGDDLLILYLWLLIHSFYSCGSYHPQSDTQWTICGWEVLSYHHERSRVLDASGWLMASSCQFWA